MRDQYYCRDCTKLVDRCWGNGGCSGGGHCVDCGGYNFESQQETEKRELQEAHDLLTEKLENEQNSE